jgi:hypothetical protein
MAKPPVVIPVEKEKIMHDSCSPASPYKICTFTQASTRLNILPNTKPAYIFGALNSRHMYVLHLIHKCIMCKFMCQTASHCIELDLVCIYIGNYNRWIKILQKIETVLILDFKGGATLL